ncbi:hypothetical protein [Microbacterium sp.]|uniref:hypothetical protein n=1 Tax=Microbacterium sp. TaxID=51671 RepID=UPI003F721954
MPNEIQIVTLREGSAAVTITYQVRADGEHVNSFVSEGRLLNESRTPLTPEQMREAEATLGL